MIFPIFDHFWGDMRWKIRSQYQTISYKCNFIRAVVRTFAVPRWTVIIMASLSLDLGIKNDFGFNHK